MKGIKWDALPHSGDLYGELQLSDAMSAAADNRNDSAFPGLAICATAAAAAAWLSDHYDFPIILLGLLIGLSLSFLSHEPRMHRGLDLASRSCLRAGIALLGLQITFAQIGSLGVAPFAALAAVMALTGLAAVVCARYSGQSRYAGVLAGGATAICGASAALALYGIIGKDRLSQAQFALTLVGISLASAFAMSVYPAFASEMHLTHKQAGFLIGASVHDVAQAIGGGYAFSNAAGGYATIVKLSRVALLAPIVGIASLWLQSGEVGKSAAWWRRLALPWFIIAFLAVVALNSAIAVPTVISEVALKGSKLLLLLAVTATAIRSRMDLLVELGWRAMLPVVAATVVSFVTALSMAQALLD